LRSGRRVEMTSAVLAAALTAGAPLIAAPPPGTNPPGLARQPVPPSATVSVDCGAGQSVNAALATPAEMLTVEISGICHEDVVVERDDVVLIGGDPATDGLRGVNPNFNDGENAVLLIENARRVRVESLSISNGVRNNVQVAGGSQQIEIVDCLVEDSGRDGVQAIEKSLLTLTGTTIRNHPRAGLTGFASELVTCNNCTIENANNGILLVGGSRAATNGGQVSGNAIAVLVFNGGSTIQLTGTAITGGTFGVAASEHANISVRNGTVDGGLLAEYQSLVELRATDQVNNPIDYNYLDLSSTLRVAAGSTARGYTEVLDFSKLLVTTGSNFDGELFCTNGADAVCENPSAITGPSNCGGCPKP